jgi:hypothetical protein
MDWWKSSIAWIWISAKLVNSKQEVVAMGSCGFKSSLSFQAIQLSLDDSVRR